MELPVWYPFLLAYLVAVFLNRMARPSRRLGNVPSEATTFVGRRHELAELRTKLATARLVSLVGPGGVGKTRLGIRAATELGRRFRDGAWFVELAEVRDTALVSNAVAAGLDLRDQAATEPLVLLLAYLQDKQLLLVLDNCEHLLGTAAELIDEILRFAPSVRVLATSREPLSVPGEYVMPVPPLDLPPVHQRSGAGASIIPTLAPLLAQAEESARVALGGSRFEAELQSGKRLGRVAAIGLALGEPAQATAAAAGASGAELLGKREGQVARLVAEGLSNKQIGARLFISERTVDGHIRNILNKLGVNSRAQIAAWVVSSKS